MKLFRKKQPPTIRIIPTHEEMVISVCDYYCLCIESVNSYLGDTERINYYNLHEESINTNKKHYSISEFTNSVNIHSRKIKIEKIKHILQIQK